MFVSIEAEGLDEAREALEGIKGGFGKAVSDALNRAASTARRIGSEEIRNIYTIKDKGLKSDLRINQASYRNLSVSISATGTPLDIMLFNISFKKKGIFVSVKKNGGKGDLLAKFFVANPGKSVGIYHRVGDPRLPIQRAFGPSIPQMMGNPDVIEKMRQAANERFTERLAHNVNAVKERYF